jgi:hypothetical protein
MQHCGIYGWSTLLEQGDSGRGPIIEQRCCIAWQHGKNHIACTRPGEGLPEGLRMTRES